MSPRSCLLAIVLLAVIVGVAQGETPNTRRMVLVAASTSAVSGLSSPDLRRSYLGTPITQRALVIRPLRNVSDPLLYEVFLQKVLFMSPRTYERHALSHVFRLGGTRPPEHDDIAELDAALREHAGAITFMWEDAARDLDDVKVIMELWYGTID